MFNFSSCDVATSLSVLSIVLPPSHFQSVQLLPLFPSFLYGKRPLFPFPLSAGHRGLIVASAVTVRCCHRLPLIFPSSGRQQPFYGFYFLSFLGLQKNFRCVIVKLQRETKKRLTLKQCLTNLLRGQPSLLRVMAAIFFYPL